MLAAAQAVGATEDVERFTHGTTVATNALLERRGARTAFVATAGFEHLLHLRRQDRAHLYRLCAAHPSRSSRSSGATASGSVSARTASSSRSTSTRSPLSLDAEAVAVCLLFSFRASAARAGGRGGAAAAASRGARRRLARGRAGGPRVRARVDDGGRRLPRARSSAATSIALASTCAELGLPEPLVMRSSGGVVTLAEAAAHAALALLSGPAAGVVGAALRRPSWQASRTRSPSTWAAPRRTSARSSAARPARGQSDRSAGCPSGCRRSTSTPSGRAAARLRLARHGRGASRRAARAPAPSPGRPATGAAARRPPSRMRTCCSGDCRSAARAGSSSTPSAAERALGGIDPAAVVAVVNAEMLARAARRLGRARHRPARLGARRLRRRRAAARLRAGRRAGDRHACSCRPRPACSRALGLVAGDERRDRVEAEVVPLADAGELPAEGEADVRYAGQSFELTVPLGRRRRRALPRGARGALRLRRPRRGRSSSSRCAPPRLRPGPPIGLSGGHTPSAARRRSSSTARPAGCPAAGPARPTPHGTLVLEAHVSPSSSRCSEPQLRADRGGDGRGARPRGVLAQHQGAARLLDRALRRAGRMVAQAEHIPVHLGAMPDAVAAVLAHDPQPGETWILNDPYAGGTHLPDLTLVSRTPLGFAATRAHHADVGGSEPGSLAAGLADARRGGRRDPTDPPRRGHIGGPRRAHAEPGRAPRRPAGAGGRAAAGRAARRGAARPLWPRATGRRDGRADRVLGAPIVRAGDRRPAGRPLRSCGRPRSAGGKPGAPGRGHDRRRRAARSTSRERRLSTRATSTAPSRSPSRRVRSSSAS